MLLLNRLIKRFKLFKPGRVTYLLGLVLILSVDTSFSQQSRFNLDIGLIGMRVTPNLQSSFVQNDLIWVDPTSGDEYFGFSGSEPRGMRFKWHYRITKNLSFQLGEDIFYRTYYISGSSDLNENGKFELNRVVGHLGFDDKFFGFDLLSSSTQFGLDWNVFIKKNSLQFYTTLNYDFYEFNQARREVPLILKIIENLMN